MPKAIVDNFNDECYLFHVLTVNEDVCLKDDCNVFDVKDDIRVNDVLEVNVHTMLKDSCGKNVAAKTANVN